MTDESRGSDASVRIEPELESDRGGPVFRLPAALSARLRRWSEGLWAPVWWRVGLAIFTLGAVAMVGARAQGEPRGTVVLQVPAVDAPPSPKEPPPQPPPPCVPSGPARVEAAAPSGSALGSSARPSESQGASSVRLVLNTASAAELDRLPGVGPKRAEEIVRLRERMGRFRRLSDLLRVRGVGPKTLKKWQDLVLVDPPPEPKEESPPAAPSP